MENNEHQQTSEIPNHQQGSSEEQRDQAQVTSSAASAAQSSTRLYECSFCKKGFSNAQALGGHMNIHRKDKAKLKQKAANNSSRENVGQPSPLTLSNPSSSAVQGDHNHHHLLHHRLSYESHVALAELRQMPFFVETAAAVDVAVPELDLELRLGVHEPRSKPAVVSGTRKFF